MAREVLDHPPVPLPRIDELPDRAVRRVGKITARRSDTTEFFT